MVRPWTELPARRVVWVRQANSTAVTMPADALPGGSPATFTHAVGGGRAVRETVTEVLDALEKA
ncbi:hypothetical protein ACFQ08_17310, partial [Streptosporangium algeriense]